MNILCTHCGAYYQGNDHDCWQPADENPPKPPVEEPEVAAEDHPLFNQQNHLDALFADPEQALKTQVGGSHYKDRDIQPVEFIHANGLGFIEGSIIKYVSRWQSKGGIEDLKKVVQYAVQLIALEARKGK